MRAVGCKRVLDGRFPEPREMILEDAQDVLDFTRFQFSKRTRDARHRQRIGSPVESELARAGARAGVKIHALGCQRQFRADSKGCVINREASDARD